MIRLINRIRSDPGQPIETTAGLREALYDIIQDEARVLFTAKWLLVRLPYGVRVRQLLREFVAEGFIERIGYGIYRRLK
jgi:hypothetical protein